MTKHGFIGYTLFSRAYESAGISETRGQRLLSVKPATGNSTVADATVLLHVCLCSVMPLA